MRELSAADVDGAVRLRLLQLLVLMLTSEPIKPAPPAVSQIAVPMLRALVRQLPPDDDATTLCLRLLGWMLPSYPPSHPPPHDAGSAATEPAANLVTLDCLTAVGKALWPSAVPTSDSSSSNEGSASLGPPPAVSMATRVHIAQGLMWGARPRVLRHTAVHALLVKLLPTSGEADSPFGTPVLRAVRMPLTGLMRSAAPRVGSHLEVHLAFALLPTSYLLLPTSYLFVGRYIMAFALLPTSYFLLPIS